MPSNRAAVLLQKCTWSPRSKWWQDDYDPEKKFLWRRLFCLKWIAKCEWILLKTQNVFYWSKEIVNISPSILDAQNTFHMLGKNKEILEAHLKKNCQKKVLFLYPN